MKILKSCKPTAMSSYKLKVYPNYRSEWINFPFKYCNCKVIQIVFHVNIFNFISNVIHHFKSLIA